jgi:uncharacterized protein
MTHYYCAEDSPWATMRISACLYANHNLDEGMDVTLNADEVRILGSLLEKSKTTPDNYPLSLNALMAACNQKTSREPVVEYSEETVLKAVQGLREKNLIIRIGGLEARVPKFRDLFTDTYRLAPRHEALVCVLLLRGPQTPGELKGRTGRMYEFASLEEVDSTLRELMEDQKFPFVAPLPRRPGTKETRYVHLFSGVPEVADSAVAQPEVPAYRSKASIDEERLQALEQVIEALREEVETLKAKFADFKQQFE